MPAITLDQLRLEGLKGLQEPEHLLETLNRLQSEVGAVLNGGATLANAWRISFPSVEIVTPSEWAPLTPLNGFADAAPAGFGAFAARKTPGGRVELREVVKRASGAPAIGTAIALLPAGYAPRYALRRPGTTGIPSVAVYDVQPASGATAGSVRWIAGDPTAQFWLDGGSWQAEDRSLPEWSTPVALRVADPRVTGSTKVRLVLAEARSADGSAGIPSVLAFPGARLERPTGQGEGFRLVLPRIDGLREERRYTLSLTGLLE